MPPPERAGRHAQCLISLIGEVAERLKAAVLKTVERKLRGFESLPLRQHEPRRRGAAGSAVPAAHSRAAEHRPRLLPGGRGTPAPATVFALGEVTERPKVLDC
jgi:hypothetical protein